MTGLPLGKTVALRVNVQLRSQIHAWLAEQGLDVDSIRTQARQSGQFKNSAGEAFFMHLNFCLYACKIGCRSQA